MLQLCVWSALNRPFFCSESFLRSWPLDLLKNRYYSVDCTPRVDCLHAHWGMGMQRLQEILTPTPRGYCLEMARNSSVIAGHQCVCDCHCCRCYPCCRPRRPSFHTKQLHHCPLFNSGRVSISSMVTVTRRRAKSKTSFPSF